MSGINISSFRTPPLANVHCHLREKNLMGPLIRNTIRGGADVLGPMPNTNEGLTTAKQVIDYINHAKSQVPPGADMTFIPIVMITEQTTTDQIKECVDAGIRDAKVYPLDRTTKSHNGVRNYLKILKAVRTAGEVGMKVHFHPEHPWMKFSNDDAEFAFLPIADIFLNETDVTIVWEHGTTGACIRHWKDMAKTGRFFVTITAHHLATDEDMVFGDVRAICKPNIKSWRDKQALIDLVAEDYDWVMAGLDDAPHPIEAKHVHEEKCACGAYTSREGLPLYAHALDSVIQRPGGIDIFGRFTSGNARAFHGLKKPFGTRLLVREPYRIPASYEVGPWIVESFWANQSIDWSLK